MSLNPGKVIISDTACLIGLTNIGQIDILRKMYGSVVVPNEVAEPTNTDALIKDIEKQV